jgi:hypothetical protein
VVQIHYKTPPQEIDRSMPVSSVFLQVELCPSCSGKILPRLCKGMVVLVRGLFD